MTNIIKSSIYNVLGLSQSTLDAIANNKGIPVLSWDSTIEPDVLKLRGFIDSSVICVIMRRTISGLKAFLVTEEFLVNRGKDWVFYCKAVNLDTDEVVVDDWLIAYNKGKKYKVLDYIV